MIWKLSNIRPQVATNIIRCYNSWQYLNVVVIISNGSFIVSIESLTCRNTKSVRSNRENVWKRGVDKRPIEYVAIWRKKNWPTHIGKVSCFQMIFARCAMRKEGKLIRVFAFRSLTMFVKLEKRNIKKIASVSGGIVWRKIVLEVSLRNFTSNDWRKSRNLH